MAYKFEYKLSLFILKIVIKCEKHYKVFKRTFYIKFHGGTSLPATFQTETIGTSKNNKTVAFFSNFCWSWPELGCNSGGRLKTKFMSG